ncbi:uncharacterized protein LOC115209517 [Octopus sinensis]|uniref:Uncharacterized protein LOC115209517 n=1 Tax=Octopus sinensis TaxID=2607531 RepID=A0A7E6EQF8_9MOLL|nr:uncharacterized protein LOC115209517 [Octopus sinensis]
MLEWRHVDGCCVQEVRWRGASTRVPTGKAHRYKLFWEGNSDGIGGVSILLAEKWVDKVVEIVRMCNRVRNLRLVLQYGIATIISAYAPPAGLLNEQKDHFYDILLQVSSKTSDNGLIFVAEDFNGHVRQQPGIFHGVHGGHGEAS